MTTYDEANAVSFYPHEVNAMKKALDYMEGLDAALGDAYVDAGEITLAAHDERFATVWWDSEAECWRVHLGADGKRG